MKSRILLFFIAFILLFSENLSAKNKQYQEVYKRLRKMNFVLEPTKLICNKNADLDAQAKAWLGKVGRFEIVGAIVTRIYNNRKINPNAKFIMLATRVIFFDSIKDRGEIWGTVNTANQLEKANYIFTRQCGIGIITQTILLKTKHRLITNSYYDFNVIANKVKSFNTNPVPILFFIYSDRSVAKKISKTAFCFTETYMSESQKDRKLPTPGYKRFTAWFTLNTLTYEQEVNKFRNSAIKYSTIAHELYHILTDSGHVRSMKGNLMSDFKSNIGGNLTISQAMAIFEYHNQFVAKGNKGFILTRRVFNNEVFNQKIEYGEAYINRESRIFK